MFKDANEFFEKVSKGEVHDIDIINYVENITNNNEIDKLQLLLKSIELFIERFKKKLYLKYGEHSNKYGNYSNEYDEITFESPEHYDVVTQFIDGCTKNIYDLKNLITNLINQQTKPTNNPKHDHIFANKGFELFEYIIENYVPFTRGWQSNLSYYYWRLYEDKFVHQRPEKFKDWFENDYQKDNPKVKLINKIKTINQVKNPNRETNYKLALKYYEFNQIT